MNLSTLRKTRSLVLLPAAALTLVVGLSGCSLAFDQEDGPGDDKHTQQSESQKESPDSDSSDTQSSDPDTNGSDTSDSESSGDTSSDDNSTSDDSENSDSDSGGSDPYGDSSDSDAGSSTDPNSSDGGVSSDGSSSSSDKSFTSYLSEQGINSTIVDRADPDAPVVTINSPSGWSRADSRGPDHAYMCFINDSPSVGTYKPQAIAYMYKVEGTASAASVTSATRQQITNLQDFNQTSTTHKTIDGYNTYGIAGTFESSSVKMGIVTRSVVIPKNGDTYILHVQTAMEASQGSSESSAIKEIQGGIRIL